MARRRRRRAKEIPSPFGEMETFQEYWVSLTPAERLRRCWAMYARLRDPQAIHDAKLFPKP